MSSPEDERDKPNQKDDKKKADEEPSVSKDSNKKDDGTAEEKDIDNIADKQSEDWIEDDEKPLVLKVLIKDDEKAEAERIDDGTVATLLFNEWMQEDKEKPVLKVITKDDSEPGDEKKEEVILPKVIIRIEDNELPDTLKENDKSVKNSDEKKEFDTTEDKQNSNNMGGQKPSFSKDYKEIEKKPEDKKELDTTEDKQVQDTMEHDTEPSSTKADQQTFKREESLSLLQLIEPLLKQIEDYVWPSISKEHNKRNKTSEDEEELDTTEGEQIQDTTEDDTKPSATKAGQKAIKKEDGIPWLKQIEDTLEDYLWPSISKEHGIGNKISEDKEDLDTTEGEQIQDTTEDDTKPSATKADQKAPKKEDSMPWIKELGDKIDDYLWPDISKEQNLGNKTSEDKEELNTTEDKQIQDTIFDDAKPSVAKADQQVLKRADDSPLLQQIEDKIEDFVQPSTPKEYNKDNKKPDHQKVLDSTEGKQTENKIDDEKPSVFKAYKEPLEGQTVSTDPNIGIMPIKPGIYRKAMKVYDKPKEENKEAGKIDIDMITEIVKAKIKHLIQREKAADQDKSAGMSDEKISELIRETVKSMLKSGKIENFEIAEKKDTMSDKLKDEIKSTESLDDADSSKQADDNRKIADKEIIKDVSPVKLEEQGGEDGKQEMEATGDKIKGAIKRPKPVYDKSDKIGSKIKDKLRDMTKHDREGEDIHVDGEKKGTMGDKIKEKIKGMMTVKKKAESDTEEGDKKDKTGDKTKDIKIRKKTESGEKLYDKKAETIGDKIKDKMESIAKTEQKQLSGESGDKIGKKGDEVGEGQKDDERVDKIEKDEKGDKIENYKIDDSDKGRKDKRSEKARRDYYPSGGEGRKSDMPGKGKKDDDSDKSGDKSGGEGDKKGLKKGDSLKKKKLLLPRKIKLPLDARFKEMSKPPESNKYDYRANRTYLTRYNSLWETIVHLLMCGLSGGIVALHEAYKDCGVWTALGINLFMAAIVPYGVCILVWSAQRLYGRVQQATLSYPDVAEAAFAISSSRRLRRWARAFRYLVEATLIFHGFASCSVFQVMIARNLKQLVDGEQSGATHVVPLGTYIVSLMLPCMLVCLVTDLKNVAPFALIANTYTVGLCITEVVYVAVSKQPSANIQDLPAYKDLDGVFTFIGICIFTLGSAHVALPLENNMNEPKKFHYVLLGTVPPVTVCMTVMGVVGYWVHGENAITPVTVHLPFQPFPVTVQVFLCLMLYVIFAVTFYIAFDVEWFYLKRNHHASNHWFWERLYRSLHIIVVTVMAYILPDATRIMGVIGCVASPTIFIYPLIIDMVLDRDYPGFGRCKWKLIKQVIMISIGIIILFLGSTCVILNIIYHGDVVNFDNLSANILRNLSIIDYDTQGIEQESEVDPTY